MQDYRWLDIDIANGFRLILGSQLLIIALFHFFNKKDRKVILGSICLIVGSYFFWRYLMYHKNFFAIILVNARLDFFVGPLVYLFLSKLNSKLTFKDYRNHLLLPTVLCSINLLTLVPNLITGEVRYFIVNTLGIIFLTIFPAIYLFLGYKKLKSLQPLLFKKAYIKYQLFYYIVLTHYFLLGFVSFIGKILKEDIIRQFYPSEGFELSENTGNWFVDLLSQFINGPFHYLYQFFFIPMHFVPFFVFLFALTELPFFKSLFLPKDFIFDPSVVNKSPKLEKRISFFLKEQKSFLNKDLTLTSFCEEVDCTKKEITDFIKFNYKSTFSNYINQLRVKEFKEIIALKENQKYDINALAEMSGFKSRATFYRIFKEIEGITPSEYKKTKIDV